MNQYGSLLMVPKWEMLNETFNNIPVEQETEDNDTIAYTSGSNRKPLLASIEKEFNLNKLIMKFY